MLAMMKIRLVSCLILLLAILLHGMSFAAPVLNIEADFHARNANPFVEMLQVDVNQQLSQIQSNENWQPFDSIEPMQSGNALWLRLQLSNLADFEQKIQLVLANASLKQADWYVVDERERIRRSVAMGSAQINQSDYLQHGQLVMPLSVRANENLSVYLRVIDDGNLIIPLTLLGESDFQQQLFTRQMTTAAVLAVLGSLVVYFFFSYLLMRSPARFWLALAGLSGLLLHLAANGVLGQWWQLTQYNHALSIVLLALTLLTLSKVNHTVLQPVPVYWRWVSYSLGGGLLIASILPAHLQMVSSAALTFAILWLQLGLCIALNHGPRRTPNALMALGWLLIVGMASFTLGSYLLGVYPQFAWLWLTPAILVGGLFFIAIALAAYEQASHIHKLRQQQQIIADLSQYQERFLQASEGMYTSSVEGELISINPAAVRIFGFDSEAQMLKEVRHVQELYADATGREQVLHTLRHDKLLLGAEVQIRRRDGSTSWVALTAHLKSQRNKDVIVGSIVDITERKYVGTNIAYLHSHDGLTGLLNRQSLMNRLDQAFDYAKDHHAGLMLLYLNIHNFNAVNQACGVEAGDKLLQQFSQLLHETINPRAVLARLSADHFAIMLEGDLADREEQTRLRLAERIQAFRFTWQNTVFDVQVSLGAAQFDITLRHPSELLTMAETASRQARQKRHFYARFTAESGHIEQILRDYDAVQWVRDALEQQRFELYFQPIQPLKAGQSAICYELLLRLLSPQGDMVSPRQFLPAAERHHMGMQIDLWVIGRYLQWLAENPQHYQILNFCSINISAQTLEDTGFMRELLNMLEQYQIEGSKLCFEISEGAALINKVALRQFMQRLQRLGCRFALDDFGSAFASHQYLQQLKVNYIKLDQALIEPVLTSAVSSITVSAMCQIAAELQVQTIAEGVENSDTLVALAKLGVDYAQGYAIATPHPLNHEALAQIFIQ